MTNKEKSAKVVSEIVDIFRCPICHRSMKVVDFKSLICSNNHTFDFAKQGYVNMLTRPSNQHYDKNLFEARQKIIMESNLYSSLHKKVSEIIGKHLDEFHYRSEEHTSELQSRGHLVCRLLLEKKKNK